MTRYRECDLGSVERRFGVLGCRPGPDGVVSAEMIGGRWMDRRPGQQQAGSLAVFADHVLGGIFHMRRPAGHWSLTTELSLDVLVPPPWRTERFHASCRAFSGGFARCDITTDDGTLIVAATTRILYVPGSAAAVGTPITERAATGFEEHLGTEGTWDGETYRLALPTAAEWCNDYGVLHGGVWAALAELAGTALLSKGGDLITAGIRVCYLRAPEGPVAVVAAPVRIGRSFGVVDGHGVDAAGRRCVEFTVTGQRPDA